MDSNNRRSIIVLCAFAVTIFVFIPTLKNELWREFNVSTTTCDQSIESTKSSDWEIDELPIMKSKSKGFRPLYVYSQVPHEHRDQYSQEKQDSLILALVKANNEKNTTASKEDKRPPFFVDLAANDPTILSNTFMLEKNGWDGVCIEPNPRYWYRLASLRTCTIIGAFVGGAQEEDGKEVDVILSNARKGGIVGEGMDNRGKKEEKRNLVSIMTVFQETNVPKEIDYFSLDVEGAETLVMQNFPWEEYSFKFVTIERPKEDLRLMMQVNGYKLARTISTYDETLWVNEKNVLLSDEEIDQVAESVGVKKY
ncbi:hypothetical protein ACHAXR_004677 [Thalassiosira sp. AJA248-18]